MKRQLRKPDKLRFKSEFDQVRLKGAKLVGRGVLLVHAPAPDDLLRCGVICGKKYSLLSVKRNRARRLCWESFRLLKEYLPAIRLIVIPRRRMEKYRRQDVTREMAGLLAGAGLIPAGVADSPPEC